MDRHSVSRKLRHKPADVGPAVAAPFVELDLVDVQPPAFERVRLVVLDFHASNAFMRWDRVDVVGAVFLPVVLPEHHLALMFADVLAEDFEAVELGRVRFLPELHDVPQPFPNALFVVEIRKPARAADFPVAYAITIAACQNVPYP